jgi:hypothetical protein
MMPGPEMASRLTTGLAPAGAFGAGGILHLYAGLGAVPVVLGTAIVAFAALGCSIAQHLPDLIHGRNEYRLIRAVEEQKMTAEAATLILHGSQPAGNYGDITPGVTRRATSSRYPQSNEAEAVPDRE